MIQVFVAGRWLTVPVVDNNVKTLWVMLPDNRIIKRHKTKHLMAKHVPPVIEVADEEKIEEPTLPWWVRLWHWLKEIILIKQERIEEW